MRRLTGLSPARERRMQMRLLKLMDRRFSVRFASEIGRATRAMLAEYEATGSAPALPLDHQQTLAQIFEGLASTAVATFGGRIVDQGKARGLVLETKGFAEFFQRIALEYIQGEAIRQRITLIAETTRSQIVRQITRGQEDGLGINEIAKGIADNTGSISRGRGRLIARTETHGAANAGADAAARSTGLTMQKEWLSAVDLRTRRISDGDEFGHLSMNGQTVDMDQPFAMPKRDGTTIQAMFPGHPDLPASAAINCRCAVAHIVDDGF
jgi:hypothetical protein